LIINKKNKNKIKYFITIKKKKKKKKKKNIFIKKKKKKKKKDNFFSIYIKIKKFVLIIKNIQKSFKIIFLCCI